jgi:Na+/proline symporter
MFKSLRPAYSLLYGLTIACILIVTPLVTLAQSSQGPAAPVIKNVELENPLNNINSIEDLLEAILYIFMTLMIPVIVFFIIYAGFKYVTAQGNASKVEEANRALLYAVIGGVLILGAVAIAGIIQSTVSAF